MSVVWVVAVVVVVVIAVGCSCDGRLKSRKLNNISSHTMPISERGETFGMGRIMPYQGG